jgi:hypothetical protein
MWRGLFQARSFNSWTPPRRRVPGRPAREPQVENVAKDRMIYFVIGALVVGFPTTISVLKGLEKRLMWSPAPAEIEEVNSEYIQYRYACYNKVFRHRQVWKKERNARYAVGDRVFVNVNSRNEKLSVLEPPLFQKIWRDFQNPSPYEGAQVVQ